MSELGCVHLKGNVFEMFSELPKMKHNGIPLIWGDFK